VSGTKEKTTTAAETVKTVFLHTKELIVGSPEIIHFGLGKAGIKKTTHMTGTLQS